MVPSGTGSNSRCPHGAAAQERSPSWSRAASISVSAAAINLLPQHAERIRAAPGSPGTREACGSAICSPSCWDEQSWPRAHLVRIQPTFGTSTVVSTPRLLQPGRRGQQTASRAHPAPNASPPNSAPAFCAPGAEHRELRAVSHPAAESWRWWEMATAEPGAALTCSRHAPWLPHGAEERQAGAARGW